MLSFGKFLSENHENDARIKQFSVKMGFAKSRHTPLDILHHLAADHPEHSISENHSLRLAIASNPNSHNDTTTGAKSTAVHQKILDAKNVPGTFEQIGRAWADHPARREIFDKMASHEQGHARAVVADTEPAHYFSRLKNDQSPLVKANLAKEYPQHYDHPNAPLGARVIAGMALRGKDNDLEDHPGVADLPLATRRYVALHSKRPSTHETMMYDEHPRVRESLARNPHKSERLNKRMAGYDPDKKVRNLVHPDRRPS